jgi:hypothetical protein
MTPQIDSNYSVSSAKVTGAVALTVANPFGTTPVLQFGKDAFMTFTQPGISQFTFVRSYQGLFEVQLIGTGLAGFNFAGTASVTSEGAAANSVGTAVIGSALVQAAAGQTFGFSVNGSTVTSAIMRVGDYSYTLG